MYILGISAFYHDSSAALIKDGKIIAAVQEERFTRIKNDPSFPFQSIEYCLKGAGIDINDVDHVSFYEDTHLKFDRILQSYMSYLPASTIALYRALSHWMKEKINLEDEMRNVLGFKGQIKYVAHHLSHAASAFYPSPFESSAVLVIDGVGEWASTSLGIARDNEVKLIKEIKYPHSLGMLYSAFTQYAGFRVNSGEYKLMGLAPYGEPKYVEKILNNLIELKEDGSYRLNLKYFDFHHGQSTINEEFEKLFDAPARRPESEIRPIDQDLAASIQKVFNEIILRMAKTLKLMTNEKNLVIAGGVGLNCVANGYVASQKVFDHIWVQPGAGDAGGALGCALYTYYHQLGSSRKIGQTDQGASLLGPENSDEDINALLNNFGIEHVQLKDQKVFLDTVVDLLMKEKVVGIVAGRMEFGPRALGARSIIGDPRSEKMQKMMNLLIKYRESFRPFAPAVLKEYAHEYFDLDFHSPYMQFVVPVSQNQRFVVNDQGLHGLDKLYLKRSKLPAITHVDYSARVQTVDKDENPYFYNLLKRFYEKTGCPVLINTSFNVRGEPIVCTAEDALRCFFGSEIDVLVLNQHVIYKENQNFEKIGAFLRKPELLSVN